MFLLVCTELIFIALAEDPHGPLAFRDYKLIWQQKMWYNPSLVHTSNNTFYCAAKKTLHKTIGGKAWWMNSIFMCEGFAVQNMSCEPFDPWDGNYKDCEYPSYVRGGKIDTSGLGDTKVWYWQGKGVYAIFGRKPKRQGGPFCKDQLVYQQVIAQVTHESSPNDPWDLKEPIHLSVTHKYNSKLSYVMEKNWMPFIHKTSSDVEHVYVVYMAYPHQVYRLYPSGRAELKYRSENKTLFAKFIDKDVHGGPPVVYVPASLSKTGESYYLGILHYFFKINNGAVKVYRHFAYKFRSQPPFQPFAISDELPLHFKMSVNIRRRYIAFVSGLFLTENGTVYITYGAGDMEARCFEIALHDLETTFTGHAKVIRHGRFQLALTGEKMHKNGLQLPVV